MCRRETSVCVGIETGSVANERDEKNPSEARQSALAIRPMIAELVMRIREFLLVEDGLVPLSALRGACLNRTINVPSNASYRKCRGKSTVGARWMRNERSKSTIVASAINVRQMSDGKCRFDLSLLTMGNCSSNNSAAISNGAHTRHLKYRRVGMPMLLRQQSRFRRNWQDAATDAAERAM